jgi:hypothetical protein
MRHSGLWRVFALAVMALTLAACGSAGPARHPSPIRSPVSPPASPSTPAPSPSSPARPSPSSPAVLTPGMSGPAVRNLQRRLAALDYYPGPADGRFGSDTLEAVWAFQEVQGLNPSGDVGPATRQALAHPRSPAVLVPTGGSTRVEINLADEVLVLYRAGQVALISHVSTGGGYYYCSPAGGCAYAITPVGDFQTTSFQPGWVTVPLGQMYNPVFFIDTAFAIHGDTYVPLAPVSHGCVRIPMDIAQFFHELVQVPGTPVYIRG